MNTFAAVAVSMLPVFLFLGALVLIDSYKLVSLRAVLLSVAAGIVAGVAGYGVNVWLRHALGMDMTHYSRYVAPSVEETLKAAYIVYLMAGNKVGFVVDAAILGFAVGTGFAFLENLYYLRDPDATVWTWVVRGFGTAVMHGGSSAILAMVARALHNRSEALSCAQECRGALAHLRFRPHLVLPGLVLAVVLHSLYNHFILQPLLATALILLVFPYMVITIFQQSERETRSWLGSGFDTDQELLRAVHAGQVSQTPAGRYIGTLRSRFSAEVIVDMMCLLRLRAELGIRAKGLLMMREAGFDAAPGPDPAVRQTVEEMRYLEKNIGRTGMLALHPFIQTSTRDLWQLNLLDDMQS